ncbi:MAG: hypothetical protein AAB727_03740, partial [Patescibacteria group bacterium]
METASFILIIIGLFLGIAISWFFLRQGGTKKPDADGMLLIQREIHDLARSLETKIGESSKHMHDSMRTQLGESGRLIKEITQELTQVKDTGKRVEGFAEQLQNLQDILKNP